MLIVGGGEVASQRIQSILHTDVLIIVVAPSISLHPQAKKFIEPRKDQLNKAELINTTGQYIVLHCTTN